MRRFAIIVAFILTASGAWSAPLVLAADDLPRTFIGCVVSGGDVRTVEEDVTCRLTRSYDFRVYGSATTECGEEIMVEIWGETRTGVVTYFLAPGKTVQLPEQGSEGMALPEEPIPCHND